MKFFKLFNSTQLILGLVLLTASCKRYTMDLPLPVQKSVWDTTVGLNGLKQVNIQFKKSGFAGKDSLLMSVQNLTGLKLTNLQLLIEISSGLKQLYGDYVYRQTFVVEDLDAGKSTAFLLVAPDSGLLNKPNIVRIGIVGYDGVEQPYAGSYKNIYATFLEGDSIVGYGLNEGYILGDGQTVFRLAQFAGDIARLNIKGRLVDSLYFYGSLEDSLGNIVSPLSLDTFPGGHRFQFDSATKEFSFNIHLNQPLAVTSTDTVDRVLLRLRKN